MGSYSTARMRVITDALSIRNRITKILDSVNKEF